MPSATELAEPPVAAGSRILRLLAADPSAAIVCALADGPLRSARLNEGTPAYSPRTLYRRLGELERLGVVERQRLAVTPPAVAYELTAPAGRELLSIIEGTVAGWLRRHAGEPVQAQASASLALLAEAWETGIFRGLSCVERSLTELGEATELTHHQVGRRAKRLASAGILDRRVGSDHITRYLLSESGRLGAAAIAAAVRWEQDYRPQLAARQLSLADGTALVASALSLPRLASHAGQVFGLTVQAQGDGDGRAPRFSALWAEVDEAGEIACRSGPAPEPDGWAHGSVDAWLAALLDGKRGTLQTGGDEALVDAHLTRLHSRLRRSV